jgi:hypothetical protein
MGCFLLSQRTLQESVSTTSRVVSCLLAEAVVMVADHAAVAR